MRLFIYIIAFTAFTTCNSKPKPVESKSQIKDSLLKFTSDISFNDFKVVVTTDPVKAKLDFRSNHEAHYYRTIIRNEYKNSSANFAGHYTFIIWDCGAPCLSGVIIDRQTGEIYDAPMTELGYDYRADSRMLIKNPAKEGFYYAECNYCKPEILIFDEATKKFITH